MKEIEDQVKVEITEIPEVRKQLNLLGSRHKSKSQIWWEINLLTREVIPAKFSEKAIEMKQFYMPQMAAPKIVPVGVNKLIQNECCVYFPAMNKENAWKKFEKAKKRLEDGV